MTDLSPRALAERIGSVLKFARNAGYSDAEDLDALCCVQDLLRSASLTDDEREIAERCEQVLAKSDEYVARQMAAHTKTLLTKLSLLRAQYAEAGWRAENTAPKDGTHVLVAVGDNPPFVSEAYYEEDGDRGWYQANTHWTDQHDGSLFPVVAWQPLPQPPLLPAGKEAKDG